MKKTTKVFLQTIIILIGIATLVLMLWMPHGEGRNVNATFFEVYFNDPFLSYVYFASISFFIALYQAFTFVSQLSVKALKVIRYCAVSLIGFIVGAEAYFFVVMRGTEDDIAGGVMISLVMILISAVVAVVATKIEKKLA